MINRSRQWGGVSPPVIVLMMAFIATVGIVGLKAFPLVMESLKIEKAMESVVADADVGKRAKKEIIGGFIKRMDIEAISRINSNNYKQYLTVEKKGEKVTMRIVYRAETKLFMNASLVLDYAFEASN